MAVPLIANSVFALIIQLIDQAMLGHVSIAAFQSVGTISNFLYTISGVLGSAAITFNILGSRAMGKNQPDKYYKYLISSLLLNAILGSGFALLIIISRLSLLSGFYGFSGSTLNAGNAYLFIASGYILLQLISFTLTNCLKIRKMTKWIFIISTTTTFIHTGLNYTLIFGKLGFPQLGVRGAALSDVSTIFLDIILYAVLLRNDLMNSLKHRPISVNLMFTKSLTFMGQEILEGSIFIIGLNAILSHIGGLVLSGYLLVTQLFQIAFIPTYMYGTAIVTIVSEYYGSRKKQELLDVPKIASVLVMSFFFILSCLAYFFKNPLIHFLTNQSDLAHYAEEILLLLLFANLFRPLFEIYKAAMQSIDQSNFVLGASFIVESISLLFMFICSFILQLKLYGIAICLFLNYASLFVVLYHFYRKGITNMKSSQVNL
ncbi:MATE family efflux transporter [Heyndrickxia acidiproducens]|uniref:MATE family efflux transporter n=1 Tax=Heyndrickxia acidiproducens TaxID=1121084 RepID=UPI000373867F|nr:MATE family efflux transporter [Heyndrickxia acidiproducens]